MEDEATVLEINSAIPNFMPKLWSDDTIQKASTLWILNDVMCSMLFINGQRIMFSITLLMFNQFIYSYQEVEVHVNPTWWRP